MRVAILTTLADLIESYSLVGVILEQAAMLKEHGIEFTVYVNEPERANKESLEQHEWLNPHLKMEVPTAVLKEDIIDDDLVARTADFLTRILPEFDVVITHDWMFTTWNVSYNQAVRQVAEMFPKTTWCHWTHSAPDLSGGRLQGAGALRTTSAPNAIHVYLNEKDRLVYAELLGTNLEHVEVCYNPSDVATFLGAGPPLDEFIRRHALWDHDLMQVYPFSMPRAGAKGVGKLIGLFGAWKELGFKVKLVMVNCHCNADRHQAMARSFAEMALREWNLGPEDLMWTSTVEGWDYSVPHEDVKRLLQLSNLFVFPTTSEACSRILQEASLAGCFVIGNESFPPMDEFLSANTPRHAFGSLRNTVTYTPSLNQWLREVAKATLPLLTHPMLKQKSHMLRLCSRESIWARQFLPILEKARAMSEVRS